MRKLASLGILVLFLIGCHQTIQVPEPKVHPVKKAEFSEPKFTSNLRVVTIVKIVQVDENTVLSWGYFLDKKTKEKEAWIYLMNTNRKYKVLIKYMDVYTDKETAVLYIREKPISIGPTGKGVVKENYVSWKWYENDIDTMGKEDAHRSIMLCFTHRKHFNIKTKEGIVKKVFKINLSNLAKELWQGGKK